MTKEFHVKWEIDITADSYEEAAEKALEIQRNPFSIATVFKVIDCGSGNEKVLDVERDFHLLTANPADDNEEPQPEPALKTAAEG